MELSVTNGGSMEAINGGDVASTFLLMSNELVTPVILVCPADSKKVPAPCFTTNFCQSNVSYFIGVESSISMPQMFLSGDRNITNGSKVVNGILELSTNRTAGWTGGIHDGMGNVAAADGSVQYFSSWALNVAIKNTGIATNRLAIP